MNTTDVMAGEELCYPRRLIVLSMYDSLKTVVSRRIRNAKCQFRTDEELYCALENWNSKYGELTENLGR